MAQGKDKERYGRSFAPDCEFKVYELNDNMDWGASVAIGDCYYETDSYANKQDAIDEQRGCLLAIKEQIEKYLEKEQVAPVLWNNASKDLEQAIDTYLATYFGGEKEKQEWPFLKKMAIHFANWQKKKDDYAIEIAHIAGEEEGKNIMKQQMMAKAIDATVHIDAGGYPYIQQMELYDYDKDIPLAKEGDKYKVILIKED